MTRVTGPTIDTYLARVPPDQRDALNALRRTIQSVAPTAVESFSYGVPAFRLDGKPLVAFAAAAKHCAFYPMSSSLIRAFADDLQRFETGKGTIRFQPEAPLPARLVRRIVKARIAELTP